MIEIYWNVALHGKHLFRTDRYDRTDDAYRIQLELIARFPAREGFSVTRYERIPSWRSAELEN